MGLETEGNERLSMPTGFKITASAVQGGRRYMEDRVHVEAVRDMYGDLDHLFAAVYDGHGGVQASEYVCKNLHNNMKNNKSFYSENDEEVLSSIREAFIKTHHAMQKMVEQWPMTSSGFPCTAGTTASVAIIRGSKLYTGHVGDSAIVLTSNLDHQSQDSMFSVKKLTEDHKPDSEAERRRIESVGGRVALKAGVSRVVWKRPVNGQNGPIRRSTTTEFIPFLAVARALGDFWSLNPVNNEYVVSPEPDVSVVELNAKDSFIVIASDGLTNVMKSRQIGEKLRHLLTCKLQSKRCDFITKNAALSPNYAQFLIKEALDSWRFVRADNITVLAIELIFDKVISNGNVSASNSVSSMFVASPSFSSLSDLDSTSVVENVNGCDLDASIDKDPFMNINEALTDYPSSVICVTPRNTYRCRTNAIRLTYGNNIQGTVPGFKGPGFLIPHTFSIDDPLSDDEVSADDSVVSDDLPSYKNDNITVNTSTHKTIDQKESPLKNSLSPAASGQTSSPLTSTVTSAVSTTPSSLLSPFAMLATIRTTATTRYEMEMSNTWRRPGGQDSYDKSSISHITTTDLTRPPATSFEMDSKSACDSLINGRATSQGESSNLVSSNLLHVHATKKEDPEVSRKVDVKSELSKQSHIITSASRDLGHGDSDPNDVYTFLGTPSTAKSSGNGTPLSRKRPVRNTNDEVASQVEEKSFKRIRLSPSGGISGGLRAHQKPHVVGQNQLLGTTSRTGFMNNATPRQITSAVFSRDKMNGLRNAHNNSASNFSSSLQSKPNGSQTPKRGLWGFVSSVFSKYMS